MHPDRREFIERMAAGAAVVSDEAEARKRALHPGPGGRLPLPQGKLNYFGTTNIVAQSRSVWAISLKWSLAEAVS